MAMCAVYTALHCTAQAFKDSTVKAAATFTGNAGSFARCMLQLYWHAQQTIARSTSTNAQARCCSMTPRDLTSWIKGLDRCVAVCTTYLAVRVSVCVCP